MTNFAAAFLENDRILFTLINSRLHCRLLDRYFGMITKLGSTPFIIMVASIALYKLPSIGERLAINLIVSQLIIHAFKRIINRSRPYEIMECNLVYKPPQCIYSFPSGHSGASFSTALVLSANFPALLPILYVLVFSVSFSRIYLGFHYVSDVVAGLAISYLTFLFLPISFFF